METSTSTVKITPSYKFPDDTESESDNYSEGDLIVSDKAGSSYRLSSSSPMVASEASATSKGSDNGESITKAVDDEVRASSTGAIAGGSPKPSLPMGQDAQHPIKLSDSDESMSESAESESDDSSDSSDSEHSEAPSQLPITFSQALASIDTRPNLIPLFPTSFVLEESLQDQSTENQQAFDDIPGSSISGSVDDDASFDDEEEDFQEKGDFYDLDDRSIDYEYDVTSCNEDSDMEDVRGDCSHTAGAVTDKHFSTYQAGPSASQETEESSAKVFTGPSLAYREILGSHDVMFVRPPKSWCEKVDVPWNLPHLTPALPLPSADVSQRSHMLADLNPEEGFWKKVLDAQNPANADSRTPFPHMSSSAKPQDGHPEITAVQHETTTVIGTKRKAEEMSTILDAEHEQWPSRGLGADCTGDIAKPTGQSTMNTGGDDLVVEAVEASLQKASPDETATLEQVQHTTVIQPNPETAQAVPIGEPAAENMPRPTKRLKKFAEAVGYAALGGVAVGAGLFSVLVATAPDFL
jgi:hypothetical protein